ncbi:DNA primase/helicase [Vibrio phage VAP7]|uniref:DnaB-like replicative helicase n=2 Tax=Vapseptimavirus VAP7 TaxID=2841303 RepID=A0A4Y5TW94_9CAUD|nr:DNA primase/helicase [Vibrio phage VAP7]AWY10127.1 DNA primase-helicase subunit [Vibrio phage VP-1]QDB73305.1 DNA primase/helicase [Vibrio phage VAP7]UFD98203.1 hypothetical protein [Vibrio phage BX-1]
MASAMSQMIINNLIHNGDYMRKVQPFLRAEFFQEEGEKIVFGLIDNFVSEYEERPTVDALVVSLENMKLNEYAMKSCIGVLEGIEPGLEQLDWLVKESEKWCRAQALSNAISKSVDVYQGTDDKLTPENLPELFEDALSIRFDHEIGHIYWDMAGEHYDAFHNQEESKIPFGIDLMNRITRGGVQTKTLNIVLASINAGKTTFLIDRAAEAIERGEDCIYYSFEVAESVIRHRVDCRLMGITFDALERMTKAEYLARLDKLKERKKTMGQLIIKEYPAGGAHTGHMRQHYRETVQRLGRDNIKVVCCDYIGEMASSRLPAHLMSSTNIYYGSIARELRAFAFEFDIAMWSAVQFSRSKQNESDGDMQDVADAISIPKIADFMVSFSAPDELAKMMQARGAVLKNRYGNKAKLKYFMIGLDNDRQVYFDLDWESQAGTMTEQEIEYAKSVRIGNGPTSTGENVADWEF